MTEREEKTEVHSDEFGMTIITVSRESTVVTPKEFWKIFKNRPIFYLGVLCIGGFIGGAVAWFVT